MTLRGSLLDIFLVLLGSEIVYSHVPLQVFLPGCLYFLFFFPLWQLK